jgi:hypothetical protein
MKHRLFDMSDIVKADFSQLSQRQENVKKTG